MNPKNDTSDIKKTLLHRSIGKSDKVINTPQFIFSLIFCSFKVHNHTSGLGLEQSSSPL